MIGRAALVERLRDLSLVDLEALIGPRGGREAAELLATYVADLEDALGRARAELREENTRLGSGLDPLALIERGPEGRLRAGEPLFGQAGARLLQRAETRRELAALEEVVWLCLPRLLEADRQLQLVGAG